MTFKLKTLAAAAALAFAAGTAQAQISGNVVKIGVLATAIAVLETRVAKLRLFRVPELLSASFVLALLAVLSTFLTR